MNRLFKLMFVLLLVCLGNSVAFSADEIQLAQQAASSGKQREALTHYVEALKAAPSNQQLREKIIKFALEIQPQPAVPEEAKRHMSRGQAAIRAANLPEDWADAVMEYEKAVYLAPWYADAYYNLGIARDKAGQFDGASWALNLYLMAKPDARDAEQVRSLIYEIEYRQEKAAKEARKPKPPRPEDLAGTWRWKGIDTQVSTEGDWLLFSRFESASRSNGSPFARFRLNGFELESSLVEKGGLINVSHEDSSDECLERLDTLGGFKGRMVSVSGRISADWKTITFYYRDSAHKQGCQLGEHDFEVVYER